jgi:hypothetical protein
MLDRGGTIRIILPNYKNEHIVEEIKESFPELSEGLVKEKIKSTHARLSQLFKDSKRRDARIEVYYVDEMLLHCNIRIDRRVLVLSIYEHIRKMRVEAPAIVVSLERYKDSQEWFDKEFSGLIDKSVSKYILPEPARK